jgi:hypothetical protein
MSKLLLVISIFLSISCANKNNTNKIIGKWRGVNKTYVFNNDTSYSSSDLGVDFNQILYFLNDTKVLISSDGYEIFDTTKYFVEMNTLWIRGEDIMIINITDSVLILERNLLGYEKNILSFKKEF